MITRFTQGHYIFRFEFTDKEGKRRFDVSCLNDPMPFEDAYKIVRRHISEFPDSKLVYFFNKDHANALLDDFLEFIERLPTEFPERESDEYDAGAKDFKMDLLTKLRENDVGK
jgi:hypothetical protein